MPSPIAHVAAGYALYRLARNRLFVPASAGPALVVIALVVLLSLAPDVDCIAGVMAGDFGAFHNNLTHSLAAGFLAAVTVGSIVRLVSGAGFPAWSLFTLACYWLHVGMDYLTAGRGVMVFWPVFPERMISSWPIFRGVQWAMGPVTIEHVWTILNELVFVAVLALVMLAVRRFSHGEYNATFR